MPNEREASESLLAAQGRALESLSRGLAAACASRRRWPAKLTAAVHAAIEFATESPEQARLLLLDAVAADPELAAGARVAGDSFAELLRRGRAECAAAQELPRLTEQALVGAATTIIGGRVMAGRASSLREVEPALTQLLLIPYVGAEEARRVALEIEQRSP